MNPWQQIIAPLRRAVDNTAHGRYKRVATSTHEIVELYDAYLALTRALRTELTLYASARTLQEYAASQGITLSAPPHWTDFVPADVQTKFNRRQEKLFAGTRHYQPLFSKDIRPRRGELKLAKIKQQIEEELRANVDQASSPNITDQEFAAARAQQLVAAQQYLASWGKRRLPHNWLELLPPADRPMEHDDAPRTVIYHPQLMATESSNPFTRGRGRPWGVKDSKPRTRSPLSSAAREVYAEKRRHNAAYRNIAAQRRLEEQEK